MKKCSKQFLFKLLIIAGPFLLIPFSYFIFDPFYVLYNYDYYVEYEDYRGVMLNRDYISSELYLKNREKYRYNAFIFGNSRSLVYHCEDWLIYLGKDARPFHFDAAFESVLGINTKIKYIDSMHDTIRYALVLLDSATLSFIHDLEVPIFKKHPLIANTSMYDFQMSFFMAYFYKFFFIKYFDYKIFQTWRPYMELYIPNIIYRIKYSTNDLYYVNIDEEIKNDSSGYYLRQTEFYQRDTVQQTSKAVIGETQVQMLNEIKNIFNKHHTEYKIVIHPLYDQKKLNNYDLEILINIFGNENVFDFSGINQFTIPLHHYYECSHYRKNVALEILKTIYESPLKSP